MKLLIILFTTLITTICFSQEDDFSKNELIVELKAYNYKNKSKLFKLNKRLNKINDSLKLESSKIIGNKKTKNTFVLKFKNEIEIKSIIKVYLKTNLFEYVEPNYIGKGHGVMQTTPNESFYLSRQWSHYNNGSFTLSPSTNDTDIDTDLAWDITQGDPNLIVAILDTGLKLDHPEFSGRIVAGYDFVNNDSDPTDDFGHGTNVAGIALAKGNNSIGFAGVNWNSKIMICKVLDNTNRGFYSWWADAIYYAVDNGAKVINLSAGGNGSSTLLENAINYAYDNNVSVVVSTGNQNSTIQYPAKYTNAIAVGSTNSNDTRSNPFFWSTTSGSNYGPEIDFVAPGNFIYGLSYNSNTNYNSYWGGTSQAAPHLAGVISLLLSINPELTVTQIRQILQESSQDQVGDSFDTLGWDQYYGFGRINAFNAINTQLDDDSDTVMNDKDLCPNTPTGESVNATGCSQSQLDDDGDGVMNNVDLCPNTPVGQTVNATGCSTSQLDTDNDGINDNLDTCPSTPAGQTVNANGCFFLPANNFSIEVIGETCPDKNNGKISISAQATHNYVATINGVNHNFNSNNLSVSNLAPGTYSVCIQITGVTFEQCFTITIAEGKTVSGKSSVTSNRTSIDIAEGTAPYNVSINGINVLHTLSPSFTLDVKNGDLVEVKTAVLCEGVFSKTIDLFEGIIVYPNPTKGVFEITLPFSLKEVYIELFSVGSQLISKGTYQVVNGKVQLNLENRPTGVYVVKIYLNTPVSLTIIKE